METKISRLAMPYHFIPVTATLVAVAMLVLTPIWAVQVYRQPFISVLLEPNNIVSKISGDD